MADDKDSEEPVKSISYDTDTRVIVLDGEIENVYSDFCLAMYTMEKEDPNGIVNLEINSPGGEVNQAMSISMRMRSSTCPVFTYGRSFIKSAACLVLASGDSRYMSKYSIFMWHGVSAEDISGTLGKIEQEVQSLKDEDLMYCMAMADVCKNRKASVNYWSKLCDKDYYFTAKELKKLGAIDIIT